MNSIRYICAAAAAAIVLAFGWFAFADAEKSGDSQKTGNNPPMMFVQTAGGATLKDGKLTLTAPATTFTVDNKMGHMPCSSFIKAWSNGDDLKKNPPKAVLSILAPDGQSKKMDVTLQNPRFEGQNLVYDVSLTQGNAPEGTREAALFMNDIRLASFDACDIYHCQVNGG
jgi:hypothetical protein